MLTRLAIVLALWAIASLLIAYVAHRASPDATSATPIEGNDHAS